MKDNLNKILETVKDNKKRIKKALIIVITIAIIGGGIAAGSIYAYAQSNTIYNEKQLEEIALEKIPGEIMKVKKELEFDDATFEYTFYIKDKENMLQEITISSANGVITD